LGNSAPAAKSYQILEASHAVRDLLAPEGFRFLARFRRDRPAALDPKAHVPPPESIEPGQLAIVNKIPIVVPLCAVVLAAFVYFIGWSVLL
jgi:hypothetical protein